MERICRHRLSRFRARARARAVALGAVLAALMCAAGVAPTLRPAVAAEAPAVAAPLASAGTALANKDRIATTAETLLDASYPYRSFMLQPRRAQGDLNADGIDDYVLHAVEEASDASLTHWLVPTVEVGGELRLRRLAEIGQNIIVDTINIHDGNIEVSLFDRSPHEPSTFITRRTTLAVNLERRYEPTTALRVEPVRNMSSLQITRSPTPVRFGPDGATASVSDQIELRERHPFVVYASQNDIMRAVLDAPDGVWLEARLYPDTVLVPVAERTQRFASRVPQSGTWHITVVSSLMAPASYRLEIEVLPPGSDNRIATRDLNGFWSSTRTSPPLVPDDGPVVYLTFDDGPHPVHTPQVLDVLAAHGAQATFFVVGYLAERYPMIVQRIAHEGHTLANHTWDHRSLARVSKAAFDRSVGRTQELLGPLAAPCIRPPFYDIGEHTQRWSAEHGLRLASWSYSPQDWLGLPADTIADRLVSSARQGAVLLLHDGGGDRSSTVEGLDMALERLADSGLEFKALCR